LLTPGVTKLFTECNQLTGKSQHKSVLCWLVTGNSKLSLKWVGLLSMVRYADFVDGACTHFQVLSSAD